MADQAACLNVFDRKHGRHRVDIVLHEPEKCQLAARDVTYHGCCFVHPRKRTECTQRTSRSTVKYVPGFDFLPYAIQLSYFRYRESSMLNYCLRTTLIKIGQSVAAFERTFKFTFESALARKLVS